MIRKDFDMFEIYIVIGFIVSGTFALRDLVFPKQAKADLEELASHGLSPGLIMFSCVVAAIITTAFWPLYLRKLLFPKDKKEGE